MKNDDPRHGTYAGYLAHRREGAPPLCEPCRLARNAYMRERRKEPAAKLASRRSNRSSHRALWRLAALHRGEYEALYAEELAADRKDRR